MAPNKLTTAAALGLVLAAGTAQADTRPNILLIVADDLGYTDMGFAGSEIPTPATDAIAAQGTIFTDFMVSPFCAPTRAMLMTGTDSHLAGLGVMPEMPRAPNQKGHKHYAGYLNENVVPVSTTLQQAGYRTMMVGKWHLGDHPDHGPANNGFDLSFSMPHGGAGHFADMMGGLPITPHADYRENGVKVTELPEDFYSSDFFTDKMIDYIGDASEQPFFAVVNYTAPHWPLQAPDDWIAKFEGQYLEGYEALKDARTKALVERGFFPEDAPVQGFRPIPFHKPWDSLTAPEKEYSAKAMQIYAAMVANMDWNIGRIVSHLKSTGAYDNTLIVFMSDNGPEGVNPRATYWQGNPEELKASFEKQLDLSLENMGKPGSYVSYDAWAQASAGPLREFKTTAAEGGLKSLMLVKPPRSEAKGKISDAFVSVLDLAPTFLDLAKAEHPAEAKGNKIHGHLGKSILPVLSGGADSLHSQDYAVGTEIFGFMGLRKGDWKITRAAIGPFAHENWKLFNLADDPAETVDVSMAHPEKLQEMQQAFGAYVKSSGIVFPKR
jgi:arylsulfatase